MDLFSELEESSKKKRKLGQIQMVAVEYPELFQEYYQLLVSSKKNLSSLYEKDEQLRRLGETLRVQESMRTKTIIRSFYQVNIQRLIENTNFAAQQLYVHIHNKCSSKYNILTVLPPMEVNMGTDKPFRIDSAYRPDCDACVFMREISNLPSEEKMHRWRERYSEQVKVVTELGDNVSQHSEDSVRAALRDIFPALSDEVHQAAARFEDGANFRLPRGGAVYSFPQILAMATVVKDAGLTPVYPYVEK